MLSLQKTPYKVTFSWGESFVLLLSTEPNRADLARKRSICVLDGVTMNFTYFIAAKVVDPKDAKVNSAMARALDQTAPISEVAIERLNGYFQSRWKNMRMSDLMQWINSFMKEWKDETKFDKKFLQIYVENGWNPEAIWPFEESKKDLQK